MNKTVNEVPSAAEELVQRSRDVKKKEVSMAQKKTPKSQGGTIPTLIHFHPEYQTALRIIKAHRQIFDGYTSHGAIIEEMLDKMYPDEVAEAKRVVKKSQ